MSTADKLAAFQVPLQVHLLSRCVNKFPGMWTRLGNLESLSLRDKLDSITIDRPVYVTGIARAGTTIMLELVSRHRELASHKYRDFPGQFIPTWWNRGQSQESFALEERAHGDRLQVTQDSPEAMEEPLWMTFFPEAHNPAVSNVLDRHTENAAFEKFYLDHLRKMLLVRERSRYLAKGNYNFTRLAYLHKIVPSSRFVVVVRHPRNHIASLTNQHRLFCAGQKEYPRALAHLQHVGHFEFGLDRRAVCIGNEVAQQVMDLWQKGEEVRGTARYWASLYGWLLDQLELDPQLSAATRLVRYEDLCDDPTTVVAGLLDHCELEPTSEIDQFAEQISSPSYYAPDFSEREEEIIAEETTAVAARFGYNEGEPTADTSDELVHAAR